MSVFLSGKDLEDVGPELTPAETATSASSTADSSSSSSSEEESEQSESEEDNDVNDAVANEEPPEKKKKNCSLSDGLIKRGNFEAVRSHLMNGDYEGKGVSTLSPAPGRTPLSSRGGIVVKKKKVETIDIALDPMDDFDMDGPGIIVFASKSLSSNNGNNTSNNKDRTIVSSTTQNGTTNKKFVKVNGFTPINTSANSTVGTNGENKKKSVNKLIVPKHSQSSINSPKPNGITKPELVRANSKEHAYSRLNPKEVIYSRTNSKDAPHKVNGKENTVKVNGKDLSNGKSRRDLSSSSPRAKVKESSPKSPKDMQHSKPSCKEPTPPKGSHSKEPSPKTHPKDCSPGSDSGGDKPLKIKIKCDSFVDKKQGGGERKSSLSPRSHYIITSSTTSPECEPVTPSGLIGGSKKSTPGSDGGSGGAGRKRSRSSSSDGSKSKDRRSGSLGRNEDGAVPQLYVAKLSPGTESGKSPPSQREPIKMTITKSMSPPATHVSPPLKIKISTADLGPIEAKVTQNKLQSTSGSHVTDKAQTQDKVTKDNPDEKPKDDNPANSDAQNKTDTSKDNHEMKNTKEGNTPTSKSPQVSPSQVSPSQSKPQQLVKKVDKRKSLEDKVFQLHKAKQNEQLQLLNRSTSINVTPSAVTTVSDGTVSTTDPYHFSDTETSKPRANGNMTVKMETQTKIKIKKDMGTSPSGPREAEMVGNLEHKKPPVVNSQRLLKPQPQPERKGVAGNQYIPTTPNLAKVLSQQGKQPMQKPDSTTGDHKLVRMSHLMIFECAFKFKSFLLPCNCYLNKKTLFLYL